MVIPSPGSSGRRGRLQPFADINITSIADVAITLLIIFIIVGSTGAFEKTGLRMNLPRTAAARVLTGDGVMVTVAKDLKITVDKQECRTRDFSRVLTAVMTDKGATQVYLRADAGVPYGVVIDIIGQVKEAGYENLGLIAEPQPRRTR